MVIRSVGLALILMMSVACRHAAPMPVRIPVPAECPVPPRIPRPYLPAVDVGPDDTPANIVRAWRQTAIMLRAYADELEQQLDVYRRRRPAE